MKKRLLSLFAAFALIISLIPSDTVKVYASDYYTQNGVEVGLYDNSEYLKVDGIEGGTIGFDASTGTITYISSDVTVADIPSHINGVKVRAIADWSLQFKEKLVSVTFPEGIEELGQGLLRGTNISEVTIPGTVKSIGDWSFQENPCLEKVVIKEGLTSIGQGCFRGLEKLTTVELPSTLTYIDNYAFRYADNLEFLTVGGSEIDSFDDLEKTGIQFGEYVFGSCYAVHKDFSDSYKSGKYYTALHDVDITGDYVTDIFAIAESQYGYHEGNSFDEMHGNNTKGKGDYAEYNYWWGEPGTHWCGEFTGWCIAMASVPAEIFDQKYSTDDSNQYSWSETVYAGGKYEIKKGDVLLFLYDGGNHVVLVESVTKDGSKVIVRSRDGNNSNAVGTDRYTIDAKTGRTLDAWEEDDGHVETVYGPDWSKAKSIKFYNVTFDANGGKTKLSSKKLSNGAYYGVMPIPTRSGYTFDGWYTAADGGTKITSYRKVNLNGDITLYAHWNMGSGQTAENENNTEEEATQVIITVSPKTVKYSLVKKNAQTLTVTVQGSNGKVKLANKSSKKLKKYIEVSGDGTITIAKGAPKGTYKVKVTVAASGSSPKTVKTLKIKVK